jgi:hypothetical protein
VPAGGDLVGVEVGCVIQGFLKGSGGSKVMPLSFCMAGIFFRIFRIVHSYMHYVFIKASNDLGLFEVLFLLFFFSWKEKETKSSRRFDAEQPLSLKFSSDESPERRLCYSEILGWRLRFVLCNVTKGGSIFPCMFYSRLMIYQVKNKALGQSLTWKSWHWS